VSIQSKVQAVLVAEASITALVAASNIKPKDTDQQKLQGKYIIHEPAVPSVPTRIYDGVAAMGEWPVYQIHCCDTTTKGALIVAAAVRDALMDYKSADLRCLFDGDDPPEVDDDRKIVTVTVNFEIWETINA
jgi:hypothetical protein